MTRWDDYRKQLQPTFAFTEKDAYSLAVADTLQADQSLLNALATTFGLKLAPSDVLPAGYKEGDYAGQDIPEPDAGDARAGATSNWGSRTVAVDPHLTYLAATALYQEVKLLNRYITDAAIENDCKAYIVRAQIACLPGRRGLPYDTYVDLGFFLDDFRSENSPQMLTLKDFQGITKSGDPNASTRNGSLKGPAAQLGEAEKDYNDVVTQYDVGRVHRLLRATETAIAKLNVLHTQVESIPTKAGAQDAERRGMLKSIEDAQRELETQYANIKQPRVIPLLVTDQIEAALLSQRTETLRQIALALSAGYAGIGGKVNVDRLTDLIESSLGRNYNSLCTVARLSGNTLRVRLGARQSPVGDSYEMVPQTHNVSLLFLVPGTWAESCEQSAFVGSRTRFAYCKNGRWVPTRDVERNRAVRTHLVDTWSGLADVDRRDSIEKMRRDSARWAELMSYVTNEDYEAFVADLLGTGIDRALINRMWFDLCLCCSREYDKTKFPVPRYPKPTPGFDDGLDAQTVVLADDSQQAATATIRGIRDFDTDKTSAVWSVEPNDGRPHYELAATKVALAPGGRDLVITFPSLAVLGLSPEAKKTCKHHLDLHHAISDGNDRNYPLSCVWSGVSTVKQKAKVAIDVAQEQLQTNLSVNGKDVPRSLRLGIVFSGSAAELKGYRLIVSGAIVVESSGAPIKAALDTGAQSYDINGVGQVTLSLTDLVAGQAVKLALSVPDGCEAPTPKEVKVVAATSAK